MMRRSRWLRKRYVQGFLYAADTWSNALLTCAVARFQNTHTHTHTHTQHAHNTHTHTQLRFTFFPLPAGMHPEASICTSRCPVSLCSTCMCTYTHTHTCMCVCARVRACVCACVCGCGCALTPEFLEASIRRSHFPVSLCTYSLCLGARIPCAVHMFSDTDCFACSARNSGLTCTHTHTHTHTHR